MRLRHLEPHHNKYLNARSVDFYGCIETRTSMVTLKSAKFLNIHWDMEWLDLWQLLELKTLMLGHGGSSAGSYLADPTSPIPLHCAVIILVQSVPVHQLSRLKCVSTRPRSSDCTLISPWKFFMNETAVNDQPTCTCSYSDLTLIVPVTTIDALRHFETG